MQTSQQFVFIAMGLFLAGYWTGIFLLSYHLIRFGIGVYPRRVAFIMILGSVFLTILSMMLLLTIKY